MVGKCVSERAADMYSYSLIVVENGFDGNQYKEYLDKEEQFLTYLSA